VAFINGEVGSGVSLSLALGYYEQTHQDCPLQLLKEAVAKAVNSLSQREALVIDLLFGLTSGDPLTMEEISATIGLSVMTIKRVKNDAIRKFKCESMGEELRQFVCF